MTHQQAIHVTRELQHKYVWIDGLCIIQDNPQDWADLYITTHKVNTKRYYAQLVPSKLGVDLIVLMVGA